MVKIKDMTAELKILHEKIPESDPRTLKQLLTNKKLCKEIIKRDVISERQLITEYNIPLGYLKGLKSRKVISYFSTRGQLNVPKKGSKYYYFLDEVQNLMGYNIKYNSSFVFRYNLMNRVSLELSKEFNPEKHTMMLKMFLKDNKSLEEIADEFNISRARVIEILNKSASRVIYFTRQLFKAHGTERDTLYLLTVNELLKSHNTELYNKFTREKETLESKQFLSSSAAKHFMQNKLDIRDLKKNIIHELDTNLSVRALNCLKLADIETLEDLLYYRKSDLMRFRNFGKKSLDELGYWLEDKYKWELIY
jgi:predicted DNA-binding protein YlxM (UPF0122 family)